MRLRSSLKDAGRPPRPRDHVVERPKGPLANCGMVSCKAQRGEHVV
jgi:hypothetical protein